MPSLSVVLPALDAQRYLARAIRSTLAAMPPDAELVVVDDGSGDATAEIAERFARADRRVAVVRRDRPGGVANALMTGIAATTGAIIARMDADDVCLRGRFRRQLDALGRDGLDAVFGTAIYMTGGGVPVLPQPPRDVRDPALPAAMLAGNLLVHPTALIRREALEAVGGYRSIAVEDFDLWLRLLAGGARIARLAQPAVLLRQHAGQATRSSTWIGRIEADLTAGVFDASYGRVVERVLGVEYEHDWVRLACRSGGSADAADRLANAIDARPGTRSGEDGAVRRAVRLMRRWAASRPSA